MTSDQHIAKLMELIETYGANKDRWPEGTSILLTSEYEAHDAIAPLLQKELNLDEQLMEILETEKASSPSKSLHADILNDAKIIQNEWDIQKASDKKLSPLSQKRWRRFVEPFQIFRHIPYQLATAYSFTAAFGLSVGLMAGQSVQTPALQNHDILSIAFAEDSVQEWDAILNTSDTNNPVTEDNI